MILLIIILIFIENCLNQFQSIAPPTNFLVDKIYITFTSSSIRNSIVTYTFNSLNMTTFTGLPKGFVSVIGLKWQQNLMFQVNIESTTETYFKIRYIVDTNVPKLSLNVLVFDSDHYTYNLNIFTYYQVAEPISIVGRTLTQKVIPFKISISQHQQFSISYLIALTATVFKDNNIVNFTRTTLSSIYQVAFSLTYDSFGMDIAYLKYQMITFTSGYQSPLHPTMTACLLYSLISNVKQYSSQSKILPISMTSTTNYFYGLHSIIQFRNNQYSQLNIQAITVSKTNYLFTSYRLQAKCCNVSVPYYSEKLGSCVAGCSNNQYADVHKYCQQCSSPCKTCQTQATICTSCNINFEYNYLTNQCICNKLYFPLNSTCYSCNNFLSNCLNCLNTTYCTKCQDSFIFVANPGLGTAVCQCNGQVITLNKKNVCIVKNVEEICINGFTKVNFQCVCMAPKKIISNNCI